MSLINDPTYVGPGIWYVIHIMALSIESKNDIDSYLDLVYKIIDDFPCNNCRESAISYFETNPPENHQNVVDRNFRLIGMFRWSVDFHNWVNQKLGKTQLSYNQALELYSRNVRCNNCGIIW